jgi:pre-mRNA-splicing factor ATP-dependent RNA helicase DHX15/PRP43
MKGILDPEGKNNNPLTGKPYSDTYKKLGKIWSKFPAYEKAKEIIQDIKDHQVILIVSGTGSGKTVLVPKYTLHSYDYKGKIAITLPKQINAKSAAEFASKTLDVEIGQQVGYQYKGSDRKAKSDKTNLLYATDGSIVARLLNDPELKDFDAVIIDEAHERKVQIDFLLYLLRETIKIRPTFKLIIMSATINADIFSSYFSSFKFKEINIGGRTNYPITSIFLNESLPYNDLINKGFEILIKILKEDDLSKEGAHDILFFVNSSNEAFQLCKRLDEYLSTKGIDHITKDGNVFCVEVFSGMDPQRQNLAQDKVLYRQDGKYSRKVVISTNVAESSLTIDGIKYVIDSGYELSGSYDPIKRAKVLDRQMITHAQAKQRMGRSGRTEEGICYHLYTKEDFEKNMKRYPEPDIRVSDISGECLRLLNLEKIQDVEVLINIFTNFIEPPREDYITSAIQSLTDIGAIKNNKITEIGKLMADVI